MSPTTQKLLKKARRAKARWRGGYAHLQPVAFELRDKGWKWVDIWEFCKQEEDLPPSSLPAFRASMSRAWHRRKRTTEKEVA